MSRPRHRKLFRILAQQVDSADRAKVFLVSTPRIKGPSRIEREFEESDQRRFFVPCPHCGLLQ